MASSYTSLLGLALPVTGELSGSWGDVVNDSITSLLDTAVAGTTTLSTDGDVTLSTTTGASNQARQAILLCSGARTALRTITAPAQSKIYTVINATTGGFSVKVVGAGPTTGVTIVAGESAVIAWNGSDFIKVSNTGGSASFTNVTVSGTTTLSGLTASTALALNSSKEVVSVTNTGTGNNVLSASPTLTGTVAGASLQLSSLTATRVTYAGASGLLTDSANLTFNGTDLTVSGAVNAGTINATTLDLTNLEVTNIKAKDGTAGMQIADSTGVVSFTANPVMSGGTANGVAYLNASKVLTTGSALTFDGTTLVSGAGIRANSYMEIRSNTAALYWENAANTLYWSQKLTGSDFAWDYFNGSSVSEQMRLTSTGLGIGTSSFTWLASGAETGINIKSSSSNAAGINVSSSNANNTRMEMFASYTINQGGFYLKGDSAYPNMVFGQVSGSTYRDSMTLDASGNLGIGTSSPEKKLHVSLATAYVGRFAYDATYYTDIGYGGTNTVAPSNPFRYWELNGSEQMRLTSTGLGIGTSSPSSKLVVSASGAAGFEVNPDGVGSAPALIAYNRSTSAYIQLTSLALQHVWQNSGTEAMRLDSTGLGIGTSSPAYKLDVLGTSRIYQSGNTAASLMLNANQGTISTGYAFTLAQANSAGNYNFTIAEGATTYLTLTNSISGAGGNLGLGVTPSAWSPSGAGGPILQIQNAAFFGSASTTGVLNNAYYNGGFKYISSDYASWYEQFDGVHAWYTAPSGTAGNAISFSQVMTLDADGDLGIGTTSPTSKLTIGTGTYSAAASGTAGLYATAAGLTVLSDSVFFASRTGGDRMLLDSSGNLGLGVTPSGWSLSGLAAMQVKNGGLYGYDLTEVGVTSNAYYGSSSWRYISSAQATRFVQVSGQHQWFTAPSGTAGNAISFTQAMTLDASGNLLVGTTTASEKLSMVNSGASSTGIQLNQTGSGGRDYRISSTGTGYGSAGNLIIYDATAGAERARIDSSGNLLVGTTVAPTGASTSGLQLRNVSGAIGRIDWGKTTSGTQTGGSFYHSGTQVGTITYSDTATAYNTSSDYRLKENIQPMTGALAKIAQLKPCTYNWKADGSAGEGFIAHELQAVVPQCVTGEKDAVDAEGKPQYQGIDVSFLVGTLTAAIQEQQAIIESLKARLDAANL